MISSHTTLTSAQQTIVDLITQQRALIINVYDVTYNGSAWISNFDELDAAHLDQMASPTTRRPSRSAWFFTERQQVPRPAVLTKMNLRTGEVSEYKPGQCQDPIHKKTTKKTSSSLLTPDPRYKDCL